MATTETPPPVAPQGVTTAASDFAIDTEQLTVGQSVTGYLQRLKGGELGSLPAILGLVVLTVVFTLGAEAFWSTRNFANLLTQATWVILIGIGLTFVLLLGEIDLSAGAVAGVCSVAMAWMMWSQGGDWPGYVAIPLSMAIGAGIGLINGLLVARVGIPSFVVTLAGFLAFQGVVLQIAKEGGTIPVTEDSIVAIANKNMPIWMGWLLFVVVVVGYLGAGLVRMAGRRRRGLPVQPVGLLLLKAGALAVLWGAATYVLSQNRSVAGATRKVEGVPWAVLLVLVITVILTFLLTRVAWGRHMYAVGGSAEASRRAGINVSRIRISGFVMCSFIASIGGMALASQLQSVSPQTGGNDTVLLAVAAAVIGGTSLFGGKGKVSNAVIGGLVVAMIPNGMSLLGTKDILGLEINFSASGPKFIATGLVLLLAASVDALSRKRTSIG